MKRILFCLLIIHIFLGKASAQVNMNLSLDSFNDSIESEQKAFADETIRGYIEFRDRMNAEYAQFMEELWNSYPIKEGEKKPIEKQVDPIEYDKKKDEQYLQEQKRLEEVKRLAEEKKQQEEQQKQLAEEKQKQEHQ